MVWHGAGSRGGLLTGRLKKGKISGLAKTLETREAPQKSFTTLFVF